MLEKMWKKENTPSLLVGVQLVQPLWKSVRQFLRNLGINLPQDPGISLLGIYPKDAYSYCKDTCPTMFITLFIIGRTWKQPRCPSTEELIKEMWYIYRMEYHSVEKKNNDILKFAGKWIDLENTTLSEVT